MDITKRMPLVAIRCVTYNHEAYIRDALEGFVMQKTNFPFVAIVHDDASTDGTAAIIREYASKYPEIIKPIIETENQCSKKDGSLRRIMDAAIKETGAKYVAYCEGDDYWTDPLKLQKQVDIMEKDIHVSGVYSNFITVDYNKLPIDRKFSLISIAKSVSGYQLDRLLQSNYIQTCTFIFRTKICESEVYINRPNNLDYCIFMCAAYHGKLVYISQPMAAYRINPNGATSNNLDEIGNMYYDVQTYFWNLLIKRRNKIVFNPNTVQWLWANQWRSKNWNLIYYLFRVAPISCLCGGIIWAFSMLFNKFKNIIAKLGKLLFQ